MQHISKNGFPLTPGSTVRKDGKVGMWDGPCGCQDCRANPGWSKEKGSVLGIGGTLEGSFLASELECIDKDAVDTIPHMMDDGLITFGNMRVAALQEIMSRQKKK